VTNFPRRFSSLFSTTINYICSLSLFIAVECLVERSLCWNLLFNNEIVDEKVDVLAKEAASTSLVDDDGAVLRASTGFILGDAGWNRVGSFSFGNREAGMPAIPRGMLWTKSWVLL